ncbi:putative protein kinase RLK-Pelle-DLSV family [Medicago truncatula]|uniref:non-specific serine/threonine protein kinase n=1 Tax=Medicago truncatula TaxID=3880 RepID=A0A396ICL0_MEDTR|nr:putative protein kinase RLK-Pelle-DLSV family [Medicago truncatula]
MYNHDLPWWRGGHWNGATLIGAPDMKRDMAILNVSFLEDDDNYVAFSYNMFAKSVITRVVIQQSGFLQTFRWDSQTGQWSRCWSEPSDECGNYGTCGSNDGTGGCVRKKGSSVCENGEGFIKVVSLKVPDTSVAVAKSGLSLEECEKECLQNCSCTAYSIADVRNGGSGCLAWHGDLIDIQKLNDQGQDLFLRVDKIELANYYRKRKGVLDKKRLAAILVASIIAIVLLLSCVNYMWKKKREDENKLMMQLNQDSSGEENIAQSNTHPNLPFFSFKTIMTATRNCGHENKLGQGGFGSVYKGSLVNGQEIAVKRLSQNSGQGKEEFKTEVKLLVKLQHRNLVRLLSCCFEKEERMLVYEYLPNKSLDLFIFSHHWIGANVLKLCGIARGVLYLHQDSRLKIIHRDLKASNVLLDAAMNPKISDFGMARIFGDDDEIQAITKRVVGTYGYMSPEYAMEGRYSTKSDVFSYGVILLEIIAGQRNTHSETGRASLNLIGHVWTLWTEGRALDTVDPALNQSYPSAIVLRCIQIGLLCVQENAINRPSMLDVVFMLANEIPLCPPQKPAFLFNGSKYLQESSTSGGGSSVNEVTETTISAR